MTCMCRSEDHFQELVPSSSLYLGSGDGTQVARLVQQGFRFSLVPSRDLLIGLVSVGVCGGVLVSKHPDSEFYRVQPGAGSLYVMVTIRL